MRSSVAMRLRKFNRQEYYRLAEVGVLKPGERVELLDGAIVAKMTPQLSRHAAATSNGRRILARAFDEGFDVRVQLPLALDDYSEPEPDLAVVVGEPKDYWNEHPTTAALVVEVADSSLRDDWAKGRLYARFRLPDYWLLNLQDDRLEVFRDPAPDPGSETGWSYRTHAIHSRGDTVAPLARPDARIVVSDLLDDAHSA